MKKKILCVCILSLLSYSALAYQKKQGDPIYCPTEIYCAEDDNVNSCKLNGGTSKYWEGIESSSKISKGIYHFKLATSYYNYPTLTQNASCAYVNIDSGTQKSLGLKQNIDSGVIQAIYDKKYKWDISDVYAKCESPSNLDCPFEKLNALQIINNTTVSHDFKLSSNNIPIKIFTVGNGSSAFISYNEILNGCGNSKECVINVHETTFAQYDGNVKVNNQNDIKLLDVQNLFITNITMKKKDNFETIEFVNILTKK